MSTSGGLHVCTVTPEEAKKVWDSLEDPNPRKVMLAFQAIGRRVQDRTIRRWRANGWKRFEADHQGGQRPPAIYRLVQKMDLTAAPFVSNDPSVRLRHLAPDTAAVIAKTLPADTTKVMSEPEKLLALADASTRFLTDLGNHLNEHKGTLIERDAMGFAAVAKVHLYGVDVISELWRSISSGAAERMSKIEVVKHKPEKLNGTQELLPPDRDDPLQRALTKWGQVPNLKVVGESKVAG